MLGKRDCRGIVFCLELAEMIDVAADAAEKIEAVI
jgi:hypothetical protein